jgi:arginyl-tRNA synthetase
MNIISILQEKIAAAVLALYGQEVAASSIKLEPTNPTFEGDYTYVVFPFVRFSKKSPEATGEEIGAFLKENTPEIVSSNVVKGFLNLVIGDQYWIDFLHGISSNKNFGKKPKNGKRAVIEYSSPNTNKPLHLGHVRNILLGWSCVKILESVGYDVIKTKVVNDRGIAICKSMLAWQLFGEGKTPQSEGIKGDHFIGKYYVLFEKNFKVEYADWQKTDLAQEVFDAKKKAEQNEEDFFSTYKNTYFNEYSSLGKQAREMLLAWEKGDEETVFLWKKMNNWVYEGFNETYAKLGVNFDKIYYESDTYKLGKDTIEKGLAENIFYKKEDGSVWIDLTDAKLDHKVLLRGDGTSLYITQDIGMAPVRYSELHMDRMAFVVADEQNYHFQVLFEILKRLGEPYANDMYHLSYGMVELPTGRMKSREGTVVDADDLVAEVIEKSRLKGEEVGIAKELPAAEKEEATRKIGLAALKYHLLKVHPKKKMVFDPNESVELEGQTGPYIQYNFVRANGAIKKGQAESLDMELAKMYTDLKPTEKEIISQLFDFPTVMQTAADEYDPSSIASYCYNLAKAYSKFWNDVSIFKSEDIEKAFRLELSQAVVNTLQVGMECLGIEMPERM